MSYNLNLSDDEKRTFAKLMGSKVIPGMVDINDIIKKEDMNNSPLINRDLDDAIQEIKNERDKCDSFYHQFKNERNMGPSETEFMNKLSGKIEAYNNCLYILEKIIEV